jgi:hypothetical protein
MAGGLIGGDRQTIPTLDAVQQVPKMEVANGRCDMILLRQGDILLVAIEALPQGATPAPPVRCNGRLRHVLAVGEATGHAHTLLADGRVELYRLPESAPDMSTGYLAVHGVGAVLEHQEHRELPLPVGLYRVIQQRQHDPMPRRWAHTCD